MNKFLPIILAVSLISACAPQPSPVPPAAMPTATTVIVEPTPVPPVNPSLPPDAADTSNASAGPVVFKIVPNESKATYEVGETFINQNNRFNLAVGVTPQIEGEITADMNQPSNSTIGPVTVDISQFTSDSNRRDSAIRGNWLESEKYPIATFTTTEISGLPAAYNQNEDYTFQIKGDLKVREVVKPVTFDVTARLENNTLTGTAATSILLSDFGVGPISIGGMLNTEDLAKINLTFVARP